MLGIVAIGRNEGERLKRALRSIMPLGHPVVYVDSGSTDDSVAFAISVGARVVELDMSIPFTAARARNAGADALKDMMGDGLQFIHTIDGDCEIVPAWIDAALDALKANDRLAVVAGRRREREREATIFNRFCDMEWNTPVGPAHAVGGDAIYRRTAFDEVGGFDPSFICGEEPELCYRLRQKGWTVERLNHDMTWHDAAMTRWDEYWKRMKRAGWAFSEGAATYGAGPEAYNRRDRDRILLWGRTVPLLALVSFIAAFAAMGVKAWLSGSFALIGLGLVALYPLLALKTAKGRRKSHGDRWSDCLLYGALVTVAKFPQYMGYRQYKETMRRGETATLIEYKSTGA